MKVGIGQFVATDNKEDNLKAVRKAVKEASERGAKLVVLPEVAMWFSKTDLPGFTATSEPVPGPFTDAIDAMAAEFSTAIALGINELVEGEKRALNTVYVTSDRGQEIGRYRKVHLYDAFGLRESDFFSKSDIVAPTVFKLGDLSFGIMTCYDLRFPESARVLVDAGADVILVPAMWVPGPRKEDHWNTLARARAIENTAYVVAANQASPQATGASVIVDPLGIVVAQLRENTDLAVVELIKTRVDEVRRSNPSLSNRRYRVVPA